jgi:uncharacterized protein YjbJ (UPF0337 family)
MNRNCVEGRAKELRGSVKEAIGKVTGNRLKQAEGAAEKIAGRLQARVSEETEELEEQLKN